MEKLKPREEIDNKFKWDLSKFYKTQEEFLKSVEELKILSEKLINFKDKIIINSKNLFEFYELYINYNFISEKLFVYSKMICDQDTTNSDAQARKMKTEKLIDDLNSKLSFVNPEILSIDFEKLLEYMEEEPKLKLYKFDFEKMFRYKKHTLTNVEEKIIFKANNAFGSCKEGYYNINNSDINLEKIYDENNNLIELNNSNYIEHMIKKDRNVRKNSFEKMYKYWGNLKNTISSLYKGQIKENYFNSEIRKYNSPLEESLYEDNIDISVYNNLIKTVHNNLDKMYRYVSLRKKILDLDELHMYDLYVDLCEGEVKKIDYNECKIIIFEALKPLGDDYISDLKKAFDNNWIDVYPNIGKISGAYSWGTYDTFPYVLLNYNDSIDSVSTLAHELGHSMHSYYSNKQLYVYSNYPIFLAEIASTVNEILLNDYLIKHANNVEEKKLYINEFLDKIKGTLYRQTMFAEFEMIIHDKYKDGTPLTEKEISDTYYDLNKLYYGNNIICDEEIKHEWKRIPHFYNSFYVYKYATGISAAVSIASDILNNVDGSKERYLELLKSGGSDYPLNLLKKAGVDMSTSEPIEKVLNLFNSKIEELEKLSSND